MDAEAKKFLGKLWADQSPNNRKDPEEFGIDRGKGWDIDYEIYGTGKYPQRSVFNQIIRELQGAFQEKMLYGCPRWSNDVNFNQYAYVNYNGVLYYASTATGPITNNVETPGTGDIWYQF